MVGGRGRQSRPQVTGDRQPSDPTHTTMCPTDTWLLMQGTKVQNIPNIKKLQDNPSARSDDTPCAVPDCVHAKDGMESGDMLGMKEVEEILCLSNESNPHGTSVVSQ